MLRHKSDRFIFREKGRSVTKFLGALGILRLVAGEWQFWVAVPM